MGLGVGMGRGAGCLSRMQIHRALMAERLEAEDAVIGADAAGVDAAKGKLAFKVTREDAIDGDAADFGDADFRFGLARVLLDRRNDPIRMYADCFFQLCEFRLAHRSRGGFEVPLISGLQVEDPLKVTGKICRGVHGGVPDLIAYRQHRRPEASGACLILKR